MKNSNLKNKIITGIIIGSMATFSVSSVFAAETSKKVIVINPGHGGQYTGCSNNEKNLVEKDITLKIGKYLNEELNRYDNVKIILTHDGVNFPNDDEGDLAARAMIARNNKADLYVSLHIDDHSNKNVEGASVYTTSREELPKYKAGMATLGNLILRNLNRLGIKTSPLGLVNDKLCNDHEPKFQYYDGSQADYYGDIRYCMKGDAEDLGPDFSDGSGVSAVLIEHCYMNNVHDAEYLDSDRDLKKLAKADANAIVEYYELELKESEKELENSINIKEYDVDDDIINRIDENTITEDFAENIEVTKNLKVTIDNKTESQECIGTGTKVTISDKTTDKAVREYYCIVNGDLNGNGKINTGDAIAVQQVIAGIKNETDFEKIAGDLSSNGKLDTGDVLRIQRYIAKITDKIEIKD